MPDKGYYLFVKVVVESDRSKFFKLSGVSIELNHYYMEKAKSEPILHSKLIRLEETSIDDYTNFNWCIFDMALEPNDIDELDLGTLFYQFYMWGKLNEIGIPTVKQPRFITSSIKLNASKIFNNIDYRPDLKLPDNYRGTVNEFIASKGLIFLLYGIASLLTH